MREHYENDPQKREADDLVRQFLRELEACTTERERIDKVMELVFGVTRAAIRRYEKGGHVEE